MGYRLAMSDEIRDWLTELCASDPPAARKAGVALTALMTEGAGLGDPAVIEVADPLPADPMDALDRCYQLRLEQMNELRRQVAETATARERIEVQLGELEELESRLTEHRQRADRDGHSELASQAAAELAEGRQQAADLRRLLPRIIATEADVMAEARRRQLATDSFRHRKETLRARYITATAELAIAESAAVFGPDPGPVPGPDGSAASAPGAGPDQAAAAERVSQIRREIEREIEQQLPDPAEPALPGLHELLAGSTWSGSTWSGEHGEDLARFLFAVEPPGTALLTAVLADLGAMAHYDEAVTLSGELLRRVRAGQDPDAAAHVFDGQGAFLDAFFPGSAAEVEAGAAALAAGNRASALAGQRLRLGLTEAQVAARMGVSPERVAAIEDAAPGATEVRTLAAYIEALGGRLEVTAEFRGERVLLAASGEAPGEDH